MSEPITPTPPPPAPPPGGFAPPPTGGGGGGGGNPWEQRDRLGFGAALIENVKLFATNPKEAYAQTKEKGDYLSPILWLAIFVVFGAVMKWLIGMLGMGASMQMLQQMMPEDQQAELGGMMGMLAGGGAIGFLSIIMAPIVGVIFLFIFSAIFHLMMMLVKGLDNSQAGFEGSLRAYGYASVTQLVAWIPFIGGIAALVWWVYLMVTGLSTLHKTTQGKALAAVLLPIVLCCVCVILVVFLGVGGALMSGAGE